MNNILIIDDQKLIRSSLKVALEKEAYAVRLARTGAEGFGIIREHDVDLVLLDIMLPDINGIEVLRKIKEIDPDIIVIMMTGYGTIESAVQAMKYEAFDYISKPFKAETITTILKFALETQRLKKEVRGFRDRNRMLYGTDKIIGQSEALHEILETVRKVSQIDSSTVLIQGESGTGKELVAKAIHYNSARCNGTFVEINCSAIPYALLESELFGHEQGAFTDAKKTKKGLVEQANGGTLFLDEIGDMELGMQAKILNVLQERKFRRLGGNKLIDTDARIIAATHHNLRDDVDKKKFRQDLFYRLDVIHIYLPPLREREEDIIPLTKHFIHEFNQSFNKTVRGISQDAMNLLVKYAWPGNVREIRNTIERIMIIDNPEIIQSRHLPVEIAGEQHQAVKATGQPEKKLDFVIPDHGVDFREYTESIQARLIREAMQKTGGSKSKAAKLLNMDRFALRYLMNKLRIS
ncbi:MAG: sigma-54 dependent transcriptional regulator [Syntrophales bacterium]|nr:sigma-54 dependent transcriptional regulator [Syntrophales bacterium]